MISSGPANGSKKLDQRRRSAGTYSYFAGSRCGNRRHYRHAAAESQSDRRRNHRRVHGNRHSCGNVGKLTVDDNPSKAGYDRDAFGFRETDDDGNGCDVREDVLARDLTDVQYKNGRSCQVASGTLDDPYTGQTIQFVRGVKTSSAVQIDHVVALENAWQSGANTWDHAKLYQFGNDMYNLLAVDGPANQQKGSASAAYWLPTNSEYRCDYVARQIGVKDKYGLTVTSQEKRAMLSVLHGCPAQELPES